MDCSRALSELRNQTDRRASGTHARTDCSVAVEGALADAHADDRRALGRNTTNKRLFLRVRVLPSGPFAFTPIFQVKWPRPADWGRDRSKAGE